MILALFSVVTVELIEFEKLPVQIQDIIENYQSIKWNLQNIQNSPQFKKKKPKSCQLVGLQNTRVSSLDWVCPKISRDTGRHDNNMHALDKL